MEYPELPSRCLDPELRRIANDATAWGPSPLARYLPGGRYEVRQGVAMTAMAIPGPSFNVVAAVRPDELLSHDLDQVLASAREFYGDAPHAFGVLVEVGGGHPLEQAMRERGCLPVEEEPAFVLPQLDQWSWAPCPDSLRIRVVETEADLNEFMRAVGEIFQMPPELSALFTPNSACLGDPDIRYLLGEAEGRSAAGAAYCRIGSCATVWGVAVAPELRLRGYGAAITAAAMRIGQDQGCSSAALKSGPMSIGLYQRMGFRFACWHRAYAPPATETQND